MLYILLLSAPTQGKKKKEAWRQRDKENGDRFDGQEKTESSAGTRVKDQQQEATSPQKEGYISMDKSNKKKNQIKKKKLLIRAHMKPPFSLCNWIWHGEAETLDLNIYKRLLDAQPTELGLLNERKWAVGFC